MWGVCRGGSIKLTTKPRELLIKQGRAFRIGESDVSEILSFFVWI